MMLLSLVLLLQQAPPTVGDTIWLERSVETPAGAEVRAAPWTPVEPMGLLGHAIIRRIGTRTVVSYPAVAWAAGTLQVEVPGPIVIRRDGTTDSLPAEARTLVVASVLPDSIPPERVPVQPEAGIVVERITSPYPVLVALLAVILSSLRLVAPPGAADAGLQDSDRSPGAAARRMGRGGGTEGGGGGGRPFVARGDPGPASGGSPGPGGEPPDPGGGGAASPVAVGRTRTVLRALEVAQHSAPRR
jgi:hypothetical protein